MPIASWMLTLPLYIDLNIFPPMQAVLFLFFSYFSHSQNNWVPLIIGGHLDQDIDSWNTWTSTVDNKFWLSRPEITVLGNWWNRNQSKLTNERPKIPMNAPKWIQSQINIIYVYEYKWKSKTMVVHSYYCIFRESWNPQQCIKRISTILKGKIPVSQQLMLKIKILFVGLSLFFNLSLTFSFSPNGYSCAPC